MNDDSCVLEGTYGFPDCMASGTSTRPPCHAVMRFVAAALAVLHLLHVDYGMYGIVPASPSSAAEIAAGVHFARALACRHHHLAAAREYLAAAEALRLSPTHADRLTTYNRCIAYANAVNTLLSGDHARAARAVLLAAAARDPALAKELRHEAASLPDPMGCVLADS